MLLRQSSAFWGLSGAFLALKTWSHSSHQLKGGHKKCPLTRIPPPLFSVSSTVLRKFQVCGICSPCLSHCISPVVYTVVQSSVVFDTSSSCGSWIPSSTARGTLSSGSQMKMRSSVVWDTQRGREKDYLSMSSLLLHTRARWRGFLDFVGDRYSRLHVKIRPEIAANTLPCHLWNNHCLPICEHITQASRICSLIFYSKGPRFKSQPNLV